MAQAAPPRRPAVRHVDAAKLLDSGTWEYTADPVEQPGHGRRPMQGRPGPRPAGRPGGPQPAGRSRPRTTQWRGTLAVVLPARRQPARLRENPDRRTRGAPRRRVVGGGIAAGAVRDRRAIPLHEAAADRSPDARRPAMPAKDELPGTLRRSPAKAQRTLRQDPRERGRAVRAEGERAHRTALAAATLLREGRRPLVSQTGSPAPGPGKPARGGRRETFGGVDVVGHTRDELLERARDLGVRGRSRMSKADLARAIAAKK